MTRGSKGDMQGHVWRARSRCKERQTTPVTTPGRCARAPCETKVLCGKETSNRRRARSRQPERGFLLRTKHLVMREIASVVRERCVRERWLYGKSQEREYAMSTTRALLISENLPSKYCLKFNNKTSRGYGLYPHSLRPPNPTHIKRKTRAG